MKNLLKLFAILMCIGLVSCTQDDVWTGNGYVKLLGDNVKATSNGYSLGGLKTRRALGTGEIYVKTVDTAPEGYSYPQSVKGKEANYVEKYIAAHPDEAYTGEVPANYYMMVCKGITKGNGKELILNGIPTQFQISNTGHTAIVFGFPIESASYKFDTKDDGTVVIDHWKFYQIEFEGSTGLYLCFDCNYKTNGTKSEFDGICNDFIVKIADIEAPIEPLADLSEGLVETNWAVNQQVNDNGDETNYSKVSIHVRDTTDIKVVIPIGLEYQCASDDFAIVAKHDIDWAYAEYGTNTMTYDINGNTVKLTITHKDDCIEIESLGINAAVLKYLRETYHDGITFEVWSWMGTLPTVQNGDATIEFLDLTPKYYVNRMNVDGASNDYEFAKPDGFLDPEIKNFKEGKYSYESQIYLRDDE